VEICVNCKEKKCIAFTKSSLPHSSYTARMTYRWEKKNYSSFSQLKVVFCCFVLFIFKPLLLVEGIVWRLSNHWLSLRHSKGISKLHWKSKISFSLSMYKKKQLDRSNYLWIQKAIITYNSLFLYIRYEMQLFCVLLIRSQVQKKKKKWQRSYFVLNVESKR